MGFKMGKKDIFTIPNILSMFRIALIPIIAILYCKYEMYSATTLLIIISGITDVVDGWVARKFHMISDVGKILDPIADKLTQATILLCLFARFPHMIHLFVLMAVKETVMGITGALSIKYSGKVNGADWHGKLTTCMLYGMMLLHIIWVDIPRDITHILLIVVAGVMILSLVLYCVRNIKMIKISGERNEEEFKETI